MLREAASGSKARSVARLEIRIELFVEKIAGGLKRTIIASPSL
jgi:hypothetical protein